MLYVYQASKTNTHNAINSLLLTFLRHFSELLNRGQKIEQELWSSFTGQILTLLDAASQNDPLAFFPDRKILPLKKNPQHFSGR